jgi:hypothetical protein
MNHEKNIIIDPAYEREQARIHRPILWGVMVITGMIALFFCVASLQGCSDDDDDKADDKAADISQCKKMADRFEECIGWDSMNTTLKAAKAECEKADFDKYDRCMFDCEQLSTDCEVLTSCFDEC